VTAKTAAHPLQSDSQIHADGKKVVYSYDTTMIDVQLQPTMMVCFLAAHRVLAVVMNRHPARNISVRENQLVRVAG
jgi:hypothetical protein